MEDWRREDLHPNVNHYKAMEDMLGKGSELCNILYNIQIQLRLIASRLKKEAIEDE
jgi:hypothetical protein